MAGPPPVTGILETCLYVEDIGRSRDFYRDVIGLSVMSDEERIVTFDVAPGQVLILFKRGATTKPIPVGKGIIPPHDGSGELHFALAISAEGYAPWKAYLAEQGIPVEGEVEWPKGGKSLYFRDPDGLLVELATPGLWNNY